MEKVETHNSWNLYYKDNGWYVNNTNDSPDLIVIRIQDVLYVEFGHFPGDDEATVKFRDKMIEMGCDTTKLPIVDRRGSPVNYLFDSSYDEEYMKDQTKEDYWRESMLLFRSKESYSKLESRLLKIQDARKF